MGLILTLIALPFIMYALYWLIYKGVDFVFTTLVARKAKQRMKQEFDLDIK